MVHVFFKIFLHSKFLERNLVELCKLRTRKIKITSPGDKMTVLEQIVEIVPQNS
jgi:hypothetical protein